MGKSKNTNIIYITKKKDDIVSQYESFNTKDLIHEYHYKILYKILINL